MKTVGWESNWRAGRADNCLPDILLKYPYSVTEIGCCAKIIISLVYRFIDTEIITVQIKVAIPYAVKVLGRTGKGKFIVSQVSYLKVSSESNDFSMCIVDDVKSEHLTA